MRPGHCPLLDCCACNQNAHAAGEIYGEADCGDVYGQIPPEPVEPSGQAARDASPDASPDAAATPGHDHASSNDDNYYGPMQ